MSFQRGKFLRCLIHKTVKQIADACLVFLLDVVRQPFEALTISHFADDAAHEDLKGTNTRFSKTHIAFTGSEIGETQVIPQLVFRGCIRNINLVPKDKKRDTC